MLLTVAVGCASAPPVTSAPGGAGSTAPPTSGRPPSTGSTSQPARWTVTTLPHLDLWLHSFALISNDTAAVPLFRRNYRDSLTSIKNRSNAQTSLDANRDALSRRLNANPALVQAQFLAFQFASFADLQNAADKFQQLQGDPKRATDQATATLVAQFAASFPGAAERDWLRLFLLSVTDEDTRFYNNEYQRVMRQRAAVLSAVNSEWQNRYRAKFERFLNNTSQRQGELLLSFPVGGEGRTVVDARGQTIVAVPFPARTSDALEPIFVLAHEVTGNLVAGVVADNTTPAQQRSGESSAFVSFSQVQGGLLLLQKIAPELAEPYARFYLAQGGKAVPSSNAVAALRSAFPLPQAMIDALSRQIDIVLGGI